MKKILILAATCLPFFALAQNEGLRTGTRIAFGASTYETANFEEDGQAKTYFQAGGLMVYGFSEWFALRADLHFGYSSGAGKGSKRVSGIFADWEPYTDKYSTIAVGLPLALRFSLPIKTLRPYIEGGAYGQANLFNTEERVYDDASVNNNYGYTQRKMEGAVPISYSIMVGAGLELLSESGKDYFLEFRWLPALNTLGTSDGNPLSMRGYTIGGGVLF